MSVIGVPIKVLHEAEGHIVTVETTTGEVKIPNMPLYWCKKFQMMHVTLTMHNKVWPEMNVYNYLMN